MANIVIVCPDLPFPADSGGNVKSFFLLAHLCSHHEVSLVSVLKGDSADHVDALKDALPLGVVVTAPVNRERSIKNFAKSVVSHQTLNEYRTYSPELLPQAEPLFAAADCIVVDHLEVMQYVPEQYWPKTVFHTHNAEHMLWLRKAKISTSLPERAGAFVEGRRIAARERRYCNGVAATLAAPDDQAALEAAGATEATFHRTYHLGDDTKLDLPDVQWPDTDPLVFFMGTLSWEPNIDGLERFVTDAWPEVSAACPDARFVIGGNNPPASLLAKTDSDPTIDVVGFVDEPEDYFSRARVVVAPLRFGSGMKLKVLESLTRGIPTVTTPIGVESIDVRNGEHIVVADSIPAMADGVVDLLTNRPRWETMRDASRQLVRDRYTWSVVRADFDAALASVLAR